MSNQVEEKQESKLNIRTMITFCCAVYIGLRLLGVL